MVSVHFVLHHILVLVRPSTNQWTKAKDAQRARITSIRFDLFSLSDDALLALTMFTLFSVSNCRGELECVRLLLY